MKDLELHELEVLRNKIKREIGERETQSKFGSGYKQALIDVEGMIMDMLVVPCFPQQNDLREDDVEKLDFEKELESLINKHSIENESDTPDFVLSSFLYSCLQSFKYAVKKRELWYNSAKENTYTEEQVREALSKTLEPKLWSFDEIIQSLKQPKQ